MSEEEIGTHGLIAFALASFSSLVVMRGGVEQRVRVDWLGRDGILLVL